MKLTLSLQLPNGYSIVKPKVNFKNSPIKNPSKLIKYASYQNIIKYYIQIPVKSFINALIPMLSLNWIFNDLMIYLSSSSSPVSPSETTAGDCTSPTKKFDTLEELGLPVHHHPAVNHS